MTQTNRKDTRKRKGDRHSPDYQKNYMRRYRAKKKALAPTQSVE